VEFASALTNTLGSGGVVRFGGGGVRIGGARRIDPKDEIAFAVKAAKQADQVVVCAGLNSDWEGEGHDRANMQLPGHMDELIAAVAKANPNTVVVMQTGSPVEMPWIEDVSAVLQAWYGGNETGNAIADALFGDINPSGKSSLSWPRNVEHNPAFLNYRSEAGRTLYGEDVYIGYRYYESVSRDVLFPFGHGLSYTTFALSNLNVSVSNNSATISVTTSVENTGAIPGAEVLQIYVSQTSPSIRRAPKELQGFEKVFLQPKEKKNVTVTMPLKYVTGYWDEARAMWVCEKGRYVVQAGTSSQGVFLEGGFDVKETFWWKGL
jgi:beta-glucosidase